MRLKSDFVLRKIGREHVVVPIGSNADIMNGLVKLSESGAFLWQLLSTDQTINSLAEALTEEYDIDILKAIDCCEKYVIKLSEIGCLEEIDID